MLKEDSPLFPRILLVAIAAFFLNITNFALKIKSLGPGLTGFSVIDKVGEMYSSLPATSKAFLFIQWGVLLLLLLYAAFKDKGIDDDKKELKTISLNKNSKLSETDLDVLYKLLKEKSKLRISTISKVFNINNELAMEWGKTLAEGKLAVIDYPRFSGPVLKLTK
ncbi:MAG: hypothetical protein PHH54_01420 [Candidatus Nanoarchaeia archaeon]|nr:hypothetical protein [Candidatus Nanoarchaeia archaeon]MDD5740623.1 hypothetical protein [Candidatus Nanoarchaeia archaeon]